MHVGSKSVLNLDSVATVLTKLLNPQNIDKWDPVSVKPNFVANLPSWYKEPDNTKSPSAH